MVMWLPKRFNLNPEKKENKNKHRRRLEIVVDMLSVTLAKAKKTRIMYQANLSYQLVDKYLENLLKSSLIVRDDQSFYSVTEKGKEFLQKYADYLDRCRRIGEEINGAQGDVLLLENMCFNSQCNSRRMTSRKEVFV